jgi:hypothetical protein
MEGYYKAFCISCENGFKTVEVKDYEYTQSKLIRDCKEAFEIKNNPVKTLEMEYTSSNNLELVSEGLSTFMKNKNPTDY